MSGATGRLNRLLAVRRIGLRGAAEVFARAVEAHAAATAMAARIDDLSDAQTLAAGTAYGAALAARAAGAAALATASARQAALVDRAGTALAVARQGLNARRASVDAVGGAIERARLALPPPRGEATRGRTPWR